MRRRDELKDDRVVNEVAADQCMNMSGSGATRLGWSGPGRSRRG